MRQAVERKGEKERTGSEQRTMAGKEAWKD